jgi:hypothetical protein
MDLLSSLRRCWILAGALFILTLGGVGAAWFKISATYQAGSSIVLLAPQSAVKAAGGNPFLAFSSNLNLTADVVRYETMDQRTAQLLAGEGYTSTYVVADAFDTPGPVLVVTVTGHSKAGVEATLSAVTKEIGVKLAAIQTGVASARKVRDAVITFAPTPTTLKSKKLKPLLLALAAGLVLTIGLTVMVDAQLLRRRTRADGSYPQRQPRPATSDAYKRQTMATEFEGTANRAELRPTRPQPDIGGDSQPRRWIDPSRERTR